MNHPPIRVIWLSRLPWEQEIIGPSPISANGCLLHPSGFDEPVDCSPDFQPAFSYIGSESWD